MVMIMCRCGLRMVFMRGQNGGDGLHAFHAQRHGFADLAQRLGLGATPSRDFQHKTDMAVLDHQALDHVLLHHSAPTFRVHHLVKRFQYVVAGDCHGQGYSPHPREILEEAGRSGPR